MADDVNSVRMRPMHSRKTRAFAALAAAACLAASACTKAQAPGPGQTPAPGTPATANYFDNTGRTDVVTGGVRMIPITTPKGSFKVWTKRVGNNPRIKVLLLHGGPGVTHEYLEAFDSYFPGAGIEYYYYDQLGSVLQRSARHARAVGAAALRRGSGAGAAGARPRRRTTSTCSASRGAGCSRSSTRSSTSST